MLVSIPKHHLHPGCFAFISITVSTVSRMFRLVHASWIFPFECFLYNRPWCLYAILYQILVEWAEYRCYVSILLCYFRGLHNIWCHYHPQLIIQWTNYYHCWCHGHRNKIGARALIQIVARTLKGEYTRVQSIIHQSLYLYWSCGQINNNCFKTLDICELRKENVNCHLKCNVKRSNDYC